MAFGAVAGPQIEQGQFMVTVVPEAGFSRLPLSSAARASIVAEGLPWATHE